MVQIIRLKKKGRLSMVIIFLGSNSDLDFAKSIERFLTNFGVIYKLHIASAHKTPEYLLTLIRRYEMLDKPIVYICVAGRSNALGGFVDAQTSHPVINCPPQSDKFAGMDILSSLRMPSGIAPLTVLDTEPAALAAIKILANSDKKLKQKILSYQKELKEKVIKNDQELNKKR